MTMHTDPRLGRCPDCGTATWPGVDRHGRVVARRCVSCQARHDERDDLHPPTTMANNPGACVVQPPARRVRADRTGRGTSSHAARRRRAVCLFPAARDQVCDHRAPPPCGVIDGSPSLLGFNTLGGTVRRVTHGHPSPSAVTR
jgi:hypothetical protein